MEDEKIIGLFNERSEEAVKQLQNKYGALVKSVIKRVLADKADAEECESDTYMAVWKVIPPQKPANLRAFLLRIARNQALKKYHFLTAEKRCKNAVVSLEEIGELISEESHIYSDDELSEIINSFLGTLSEETRRIFILRYWYFHSAREIADNCGITISKTETVLCRTRKKLKKYLDEKGVKP
ncbi:MAG: sigma-70 family RNA polymerase sigma factor [Oscillospiraceae bacterium]|nr:sigma-70 family RNA polymerase sigma factor [Oscillospiraceae bacterium]